MEKKVFVEFLRPSELRDYQPPPGVVLVGDNHITRGSVFVLGGAPGVGKSRASVALAEAGATGYEWFNLKIHSKFKTLIVQNENGRFRLKQEFAELECEALEDYVRVTPPPPLGFCFERPEFRAQLSEAIGSFLPDVVIFDPWNAASRDEKARSMLDTFESIRSVIPASDNGPAVGIVAHTKKPQPGERSSGRALLQLLSGSYVLGSVPRCVFVMQSATDDVSETRVVLTCCKNNDGDLGKRSVWERRNGLFTPVHEFDWNTFDHPEGERREITAAIMEEVFGDKELSRSEAKDRIMAKGFGSAAAYRALESSGRFSSNLSESKNGRLKWDA